MVHDLSLLGLDLLYFKDGRSLSVRTHSPDPSPLSFPETSNPLWVTDTGGGWDVWVIHWSPFSSSLRS